VRGGLAGDDSSEAIAGVNILWRCGLLPKAGTDSLGAEAMNMNDPVRPRVRDAKAATSKPILLFPMPLSELHHHIRTALHHIVGYTEILLEDGEARNYSRMLPILRQAHVEAKSTQTAVDTLLSVPRVAAELRFRELRDRLREAGDKMIMWGEEMEELAGLEENKSLVADISRFLAAAHGLIEAADLINASQNPTVADIDVVPKATSLILAEAAAPDPAGLGQKSQGSGGKGLLLVVDDNEANRDILLRRLKLEGYGVLIAESGHQALEMVREKNPDLVLLDVMMPGLDGFAVLRELKEDPRSRHIPVIMISSVSEIQSVVRCIEMGAEDYVSKPFDPILLRARVGALLERKRMRDEEQRKNEELEKALLDVRRQRRVAEELLLNILPERVAEELQSKGCVEPMYFEDVTIVFADFVGFTLSTEKLPADRLVRILHEYFTAFDGVMVRYELEKLKTIGDCYMFAGGLPVRNSSHPVDAVLAALEMVHIVEQMAGSGEHLNSQLRVGIHTGPVIAGVVGIRKFAFDIWGDAVNFSARTEQGGAPGRVNLSATTYARVKDFFACEHRGKIKTKDGRKVDMYFVGGAAPTLLGDESRSLLSLFEARYRTYFQKELKSFPEYLLDKVICPSPASYPKKNEYAAPQQIDSGTRQ
jgi:adenylate cyclase